MAVRSCVACRKRRDTSELIRIVLQLDGQLWLSGDGARPAGRGASCCSTNACLQQLVEHPQRLSRALKSQEVKVDDLLLRAAARFRLK